MKDRIIPQVPIEDLEELQLGVDRLNKKYTRKEVVELLEKQRQECLRCAKVISYEYVNPYSDSDGQREYGVEKNSILNAKISF